MLGAFVFVTLIGRNWNPLIKYLGTFSEIRTTKPRNQMVRGSRLEG